MFFHESSSVYVVNNVILFFFLISKGNFIQDLNNESPEYTRSIQPGTNIIKYINYKHPSNHRPKQ